MAIEFDFREISLAGNTALGSGQETIECVIDTAAKGGVSKILSCCGDVKISGVVGGDKTVKVSGIFNCKVICLNIEGQFSSYDYNCDFSTNIPALGIDHQDEVEARACILDLDSGIKDGKIAVQAVCDISANAIESRKIRVLTSVGGDVFAKDDDKEILEKKSKISHNFTLVEEYESGVNIDKVLLFDCSAICCSASVGDGKVTVNGEVSATVVYESNSTVTTKNLMVPFAEDIILDVNSRDLAQVKAIISSAKIILGGNEDNNIMRLEFGLTAVGQSYSMQDINIISDVYSVTNQLNVTKTEEKFYSYNGSFCVKEKIAGAAELAEQTDGVRRVLSCCATRNCVTNVFAGDDRATVEGVLAASVIYEDSNTDISSLQIELPYSFPFENDNVDDDDRLSADAMVEILAVKVKRDREIEVTAMISLQISIEKKEELSAISELTVGDAKVADTSAITIYHATAAEDMWDIAKAIGAPTASILAQNPSLISGIGKAQKVAYYRQLSSN